MAVLHPELARAERSARSADAEAEWPGWPAEVALRLGLTRLPRLMAVVAIGLLVLHVLAAVSTYVLDRDTVYGLVPLVRMHGEGTLPAWWSSLTLLLTSALLLLAGRVERVASRPSRPCVSLTVVFGVLALERGRGLPRADHRAAPGRARHPYTQGLVAASPAAEPGRFAPSLGGEPPSPIGTVEGCPFASRCPIVPGPLPPRRPPPPPGGHRSHRRLPLRVGPPRVVLAGRTCRWTARPAGENEVLKGRGRPVRR